MWNEQRAMLVRWVSTRSANPLTMILRSPGTGNGFPSIVSSKMKLSASEKHEYSPPPVLPGQLTTRCVK
jgi:hypothetical protein